MTSDSMPAAIIVTPPRAAPRREPFGSRPFESPVRSCPRLPAEDVIAAGHDAGLGAQPLAVTVLARNEKRERPDALREHEPDRAQRHPVQRLSLHPEPLKEHGD